MNKCLFVKILLLNFGFFYCSNLAAIDFKSKFGKSSKHEELESRRLSNQKIETSRYKSVDGRSLPPVVSRGMSEQVRGERAAIGNKRKRAADEEYEKKSKKKILRVVEKKPLAKDEADRLAQEKKLDKIDRKKLIAARAEADRRTPLIEKVKEVISGKPKLKPAIADNTYLHGKEKELALAATVKGGDDFHKIFSGDLKTLPQLSEKPTKAEKAAYKESLHDMSWFLFNAAAKGDKGKGDKGMASGMILLDGPGAENFHKYVENYVKAVSPYPPGKLISLDKSGSGAYERESSHFKGIRKTSYGIDLDAPIITRPDAKGKPNYKSHLHVGQLEDGRVFVKFEQYGLGKQEFLAHAGGFVTKDLIPKLKARFKGDDEQKEKSIQELLNTGEIKNPLHRAIANKELEQVAKQHPLEEPEGDKSSRSLQRGEKWPKGYNPLFESMLREKGVHPEEIKTIMKDVKNYGLQAMHKHAQEKGLEVTDPEGNKHSFSETLEKKYGSDIKTKFFNEVELKTDDLQKEARKYHKALTEPLPSEKTQESWTRGESRKIERPVRIEIGVGR